jgi:ubiquinone/menaquinone biosynthesis C-methylase UbiE
LSEPPPTEKKKSNLHRVEKYYNEFADDYDEVYEENTWRLYDDLTWHFLQPALPPISDQKNPPYILDIGGGTGKWAIKLAELGYKILCGDISKPMLEKAKEKINAKNLIAQIGLDIIDIRNMVNIATDTFDMVLAVGDVISYALDDNAAVEEIYRVLKPGGSCVASVDNMMMYIINEMKSNHFERINPLMDSHISNFFNKHPVRTYLPEDLQQLFASHGFEVIQIVGKPVISSLMPKKVRQHKLDQHYDEILALEKRFGMHPNYLGHGGHLQIYCKKK